MFRSDGGGERWHLSENGLPASSAAMTCGLVVDPEDPDVSYGGYTDGAIFTSRDAGDSWEQLSLPLTKPYGLALLADGA